MKSDLAQTIAAIIDPVAWDRAGQADPGRRVLKPSDRTEKMDKNRRDTSMRIAIKVIEAFETHFLDPSAADALGMGEALDVGAFSEDNMLGYAFSAYCAGWSAAVRCLASPNILPGQHSQRWFANNPPFHASPPKWRAALQAPSAGKAQD